MSFVFVHIYVLAWFLEIYPGEKHKKMQKFSIGSLSVSTIVVMRIKIEPFLFTTS